MDAKKYLCPFCGLVFFCTEEPDQGCCSAEHAEIYLAWSETDAKVPLSTFAKYWADTFKPQTMPLIRRHN